MGLVPVSWLAADPAHVEWVAASAWAANLSDPRDSLAWAARSQEAIPPLEHTVWWYLRSIHMVTARAR